MVNPGLRVGIILEGTYPYVTGGVSGWAQSIMSQMKAVEFTIIHIGAKPEKRELRYQIPDNVKEIYEFSLQSITAWKKKKKLRQSQQDQFISTLSDIFSIDRYKRVEKLGHIRDILFDYDLRPILHSKAFWDLLVSFYRKSLPTKSFTRYYWNLQGIIQPILNCLMANVPRCDVYHTVTTGYAGIVGVSASYQYNAPLILTEHGIYHREREREIVAASWLEEVYKPIWINLFKLISRYVYMQAAKVTTLFEKNQLFQLELGCDIQKMKIIPNGINVERFMELSRQDKKDTFVVGMVGRVVSIKDIKMALRCARLVKDAISDFKLLIIGPTEEEEAYFKECQKLVEVFDLEETVHFTGSQNVLEYYPKMNALLLTSVSEGQPLVILEAMAAGLPVVATDVGGCSELIFGSKDEGIDSAGYIVPPKDYESAAKYLIRLYEKDEVRIKFRENGEKRVQEKYLTSQMIERYHHLYKEVM